MQRKSYVFLTDYFSLNGKVGRIKDCTVVMLPGNCSLNSSPVFYVSRLWSSLWLSERRRGFIYTVGPGRRSSLKLALACVLGREYMRMYQLQPRVDHVPRLLYGLFHVIMDHLTKTRVCVCVFAFVWLGGKTLELSEYIYIYFTSF